MLVIYICKSSKLLRVSALQKMFASSSAPPLSAQEAPVAMGWPSSPEGDGGPLGPCARWEWGGRPNVRRGREELGLMGGGSREMQVIWEGRGERDRAGLLGVS